MGRNSDKTIVFVDIVESTRLFDIDEERAAERIVAMLNDVGAAIQAWPDGCEIRRTGDGVIATFSDPGAAVAFAVDTQELAQRRETHWSAEERIFLRVGAHRGRVIAAEGDIFGKDVNSAARIAAACAPGEILISEAVRDRMSIVSFEHEDLGEKYFKHISGPIRVFRVGARRRHALPATVAPIADANPVLAIGFTSSIANNDTATAAIASEVATTELTRLMATSRMMTVVSASSSTAAIRAGGDWMEAVGANFALTGDVVAKGADRIEADLRLIERDGGVIWDRQVATRVTNLIGPEPAESLSICEAVCGKIAEFELLRAAGASPDSLASYSLLLSGLAHMHRLNRAEFEKAPTFFAELLRRAPRQAAPNAWLAYWHVMRATQRWAGDPETVAAHAIALSDRALEVDADCALAFAVQGLARMNLLRDPTAAASLLEDAVATGPNEAIAWAMRSTLRAFTDDGEAAVADAERALRLAPLDPQLYYFEGHAAGAYFTNRNYENALELATRSYRGNRRHMSTLRIRIASLAMLDRVEDARALVAEMSRLDPQFRVSDYERNAPNAGAEVGRIMARALREAGAPD